MTIIIGLVFVGWVLYAIIRAAMRSTGSAMLAGTPARGILLAVDSVGTKAGFGMESRRVTVDVEIPGQPAYEVRTMASFPASVRGDVLPGATVELRVNARNKNATITIVGPGVGFTVAALNAPRQP